MMEDQDELAALRAKRLAQLKASRGSDVNLSTHHSQASSQDQQQQQQQQEMKHNLLYQILSSEARERLSRIKMVKPEKAQAVENMLIQMAQGGQIRDKVTEKQLIDLLEQISGQSGPTRITRVSRYDDEDDYGLDED